MNLRRAIAPLALAGGSLIWLLALTNINVAIVGTWLALLGLTIWAAEAPTELLGFMGTLIPLMGSAFLGPSEVIATLVFMVLPSAILASRIRRGSGLGLAILGSAIPPGIAVAAFFYLTPGFYAGLEEGVNNSLQELAQVGLPLPGGTVGEWMLMFFPILSLGWLLSLSVSAGVLAAFASAAIKGEQQALPPMGEWNLSGLWLGVTALAGMAALFGPQPWSEIGLNVVVLCGMLYTFLGFSVLHYLLVTAGVGVPFIALIYLALLFMQVFAQVPLIILGLLESAFEIRARSRSWLKRQTDGSEDEK